MFIVIGIMLAGVFAGYLLRGRKLKRLHWITTMLIWILLFLLGISVGGNEAIVKGLYNIGLEALLITLAAVAGSTLFAWGLWFLIYVRHNREGARK